MAKITTISIEENDEIFFEATSKEGIEFSGWFDTDKFWSWIEENTLNEVEDQDTGHSKFYCTPYDMETGDEDGFHSCVEKYMEDFLDIKITDL